MNTTTTRIRRHSPAAIALLIVLGLAGCAGATASTEADVDSHQHPASARLSLDQQRVLNLLVNDNDPRGLHGANTGQHRMTSITSSRINDDDPRGLHGVTTNGW